LLKVKSNTHQDPSVAEAGVIVATVGIVIVDNVPVAGSVISNAESFVHFINVSAVVGTDTVPVVAPAGTVTSRQ
jgi:hypothetical protein